MRPLSDAIYWEARKKLLMTIPVQQLVRMAQADWHSMAPWLKDLVGASIIRQALPIIKGVKGGDQTGRLRRLMPDMDNPPDMDDLEGAAFAIMQEGLADPKRSIGVTLASDFAKAVVSCVVAGCYRHVRDQHGVKEQERKKTWPDPLTGQMKTSTWWNRSSPLLEKDPDEFEIPLPSRRTSESEVEFQADLNAAMRKTQDPKHRQAVEFLLGGGKLEDSVATIGVAPRTVVNRFVRSNVGRMLEERLRGDGDEDRTGARDELRKWTGKGDVKQVGAGGSVVGGGTIDAPSEDEE